MKFTPPILLFIFISITTNSQTLKRYPIGKSGSTVYMLCDPGQFDLAYSEDSSEVYTSECIADSTNYGVICVKLKQSIDAVPESEDMMISYLDHLKKGFNIKSSVGYGKGHTMDKKPEAKGVIDYWTDESGDEWKVKAWTDGKYIAVLYVYANGKLADSTKYDVFLNGFRFPDM